MATIFKAPIKLEILKKSSTKKLKDKPKGLYGGEDGFRSNLKNATKKESYINKALVKKTYTRGRSSREDRSPDNSRFRKKSPRDRSRSPARDKSDRDKKHGGTITAVRERGSSTSLKDRTPTTSLARTSRSDDEKISFYY